MERWETQDQAIRELLSSWDTIAQNNSQAARAKAMLTRTITVDYGPLTREQVQLLRFIALADGISARSRGITKKEASVYHRLGFITMGVNGYSSDQMGISPKGKAYLESIGAATFGNPLWDDEYFADLMKTRRSLFQEG
jgi:hypothetical protein